jgi:hypothetical protein
MMERAMRGKDSVVVIEGSMYKGKVQETYMDALGMIHCYVWW